jgi:UDPglucose 6-dehydrogenase
MSKGRPRKVGIVGYGYVGQLMTRFFQTHHHVAVYDPYIEEFPAPSGGTRDFHGSNVDRTLIDECDLAIVCVPTPATEDGRCDTSIVEEVVGWLKSPLIIIKSTIEPGTTDRLREKTCKRIVFSPEYSGESSYWTPYEFHRSVVATPFFIFGGEKKDTSECVDLFLPIAGPTKVYRQTTALAAEFAKYTENCFYAAKIAFCYEMANLIAYAGEDWNEVRELWVLDPRLNPMHTAVFKENDRPFGGKCLPKDLRALIQFGTRIGYVPELLEAVLSANQRICQYRSKSKGEQQCDLECAPKNAVSRTTPG